MVFLILPNEETAVARSGAGWHEDMRAKNQDKHLWQAQVGNDGRTALVITAGTEGLLTQQETAALVPELDPINWPSTPRGGEGEV
jgi:hypothetical protein